MFSSRLALAFSLILTVTTAFVANAAVVKAVKDKSVLVDMQSDNFKEGDVLKVVDGSGKTVGLIKVQKVKGTLAKGIFKGKVDKGQSVALKTSAADAKSHASSGGGSKSSHIGSSEKTFGIIGGLSMNSATATLAPSGSKASMSGMGFNLKGLMDTQLLPWLNFRGMAGFQQFTVTGTDPSTTKDCGGGACNASVLYLGADFLGRYMITNSIWVGAGADLMFPMTKSATAIATGSISNTLVYEIAGGYDMHLASGSYIPIQVDYDLFPTSSTVTAHMLSIRAGYAKSW